MKLEKVTNGGEPATKRWYDDACGTALALELIGERWSLLIVRELVFGPRRFGQIKANLPGVSANVLTQRLEGLSDSGIVVRRRLPAPASVQVYDLSDWGRDAAPLIRELGRWAARSPRHDKMAFMSPASAMMSLETLINGAKIGGDAMTIAFRFPDDAFVVTVQDGAMAVQRGEAADAHATFTGDTMALRMTIYGKLPLSREGAGGGMATSGDLGIAARFVDLFALPKTIG